jgi:hypothetical protein
LVTADSILPAGRCDARFKKDEGTWKDLPGRHVHDRFTVDQCQGAIGFGVLASFLLGGCANGSPPPTQPTPAAEALPPFSVSGSVTDTALRPLGGARVEIVSGQNAGAFAIAGEDSHFKLPGTFTDTITLVASKAGHTTHTRTVAPFGLRPPTRPVDGREFSVAFELGLVGSVPADISGLYTVMLTAASTCNLPEEARTRTYTAAIVPSQSPTRFLATLSDARFFERPCPQGGICTHNTLNLGVAGDVVGAYTGLVERIGESNHLVVSASAEGTVTPAGIAGRLGGDLYYCPGEPYLIDQGTWVCQPGTGTWCSAQNHQLTLLRR